MADYFQSMNRTAEKTRRSRPEYIAYGAIIIALAVALGFVLAPVPNIELVTLTLAFGGYLLGGGWGALIGAMGFGLYSMLSPYGIAPPPLFAAQIIGGGVIGFGGAMLRKIAFNRNRGAFIKVTACAITGLIVTLIYDILTNIGSFVLIASETTFIPFLVGGLGFAIVHIAANCVIFALLFPIIAGIINGKKKS